MVLVSSLYLFVNLNYKTISIKFSFILLPRLVDKIIISKGSLKILCNEMIPLSFKSISDINFTKLNTISLRLIGCYGNHILIAKLLLSKKIINKEM